MEPSPTEGLLYLPMTSDADYESGTPAPGSKRRRLRGACDTCRQKKGKFWSSFDVCLSIPLNKTAAHTEIGDSAKMPNNICSNCIAFNAACTHHGYTKPDSSKKPPSLGSGSAASSPKSGFQDSNPYNGKTAQEHVDTILVQSTAYIAARDLRNILLDIARYSRKLEQDLDVVKSQLAGSRGSSVVPAPSPPDTSTTDDSAVVDSSPDGIMILSNDFEDMTIVNPTQPFFCGRSSGLYLIETAQAMKAEHDGPNVRQPEPTRRKEFWHCPWEITPPPPAPVYSFPPKDLLDDLVSIFFDRVNIIMNFLHRPTFERSLGSGLHLIDHSFGSVVLAVCALASRYSDDPRVILKGTNTKLSSGWQWFEQIRYPLEDFHHARTLPDLQRIFLSILYLQGTCSPCACWTLTAIGIRDLQDLGLHMRKRKRGEHHSTSFTTAVEEELYTRIFWMFVCSDALMSAFIGKPRIMRDDDYDIDYPVECDDEYWEHPDPKKRFKQPEGKPSVASFIVSYLKLTEILGTAQKTIYSVKRSQRGPEWSQAAVAELDSALNQWLDSIPDHLRWDPNREKEPFATQSACLYAGYYHVQIQIHRSFIPSPMNNTPLSSSYPSLAICANSSRSLSRVMEIQARRSLVAHPQVVSALMDAAIVILLNVWGAGRTGISVDPQRAINDVKKCISVLKMYELHWQAAGRYCDLLFTVGNQLISNPPAPSKPLKRSRDPEIIHPPVSAASVPSQAALHDSRNVAGSRRVSAAVQQQQQEKSQTLTSTLDCSNLLPLYPLPVSTAELGHLPVYQSFDWGMPFESDRSSNAGTGFSFNNNFEQYGSDLGFTISMIDASGASSQFSQPNSFAEYDGGDWATRDWTTYIDIMQSFD
ncbi:Zn(2)-C6 fungal-type domain-containing protein [Mycena venus]|uniref:Zn(2)-C6 fungal-type domain-containing protein n=1 Tax=Mycena venus TaxID=2733690 RepID=A0A8H7DAF5_9AGAR|nr:Zn(2)-C6 fungal-type domain-containing protein [Mycena venus]